MDVATNFAGLDTIGRDDSVGIAIAPGLGLGLARGGDRWAVATDDPLGVLADLHATASPRWVWWGRETSSLVAAGGLPIDRCWDIAAVHRLLHGTWRSELGEIWASIHGLDIDSLPAMGQLGLLDAAAEEGNVGDPIRPDGHLRPEWVVGGYTDSPERLAVWAGLTLQVMEQQELLLTTLPNPERAHSTSRSESAAELLCAELAGGGLPIDEAKALELIGEAAGPRPTSSIHEAEIQRVRDEAVLSTLEIRHEFNLRNPGEVKSMLRREGFDLPDTRAGRLEQLRDSAPVIDALLTWRKDERIATTYGYRWFDEHVEDGRLRGGWSSADGAAGRMTASAGLHNLPSMMRPMVRADEGHLFVRADLGQIEPRVLAAVSGDEALIEATTLDDDLYQPIAHRLGVERAIAKLAVLGAMYGATTGESAGALAGLQKNYPVAMALLDGAAASGKCSEDVFTSGGRRIRMSTTPDTDGDIERAVSAAAGRGRYARNAIIQGAAAEFFKVWAITVRRRGRELGGEIVLCLHDELIVQCPNENAEAVAALVDAAVHEAAHYWTPEPTDALQRVRFVADVSIIERWSEAK